MRSRIISLLKTVRHRLLARAKTSCFLLESPEGIRLMLAGSAEFQKDLTYLWGLSSWKSTGALHRRSVQDTADLKIEEKIGSPNKAGGQSIRTQLLVDMLTPMRSDFDLFLLDVLSKKKRYHVKKALAWEHSLEFTRDSSKLDLFLNSMLHPQTASTHKEQAHQLIRSDILGKGEHWQLLLLQEGPALQGGSLLLHSKRQGVLRIWRQAVHPSIDDAQAINRIKVALDAAAIKAACEAGYEFLSFGLAPHIIEHGNFYSKKLWACEPSWNQVPQFVDIRPLSERGAEYLEQIPMVCAGTEEKLNAVLVPKSRFAADPEGLKSWLDQFAFSGLRHLAVWDAGQLTLHPSHKATHTVNE